jgi:hypothetical protein
MGAILTLWGGAGDMKKGVKTVDKRLTSKSQLTVPDGIGLRI